MRLDSPRASIVILFTVSLGYACFGVIARELARELATFQQSYLRALLALVFARVFFSSCASVTALSSLSVRDYWILALRTLMGYPLGVGFFVLACNATHLANVAFICALPLTAVWAIVLFGERPSRVSLWGLVLSVVGLALVTLNDVRDLTSVGHGELYALISAAGFSFALVSRRYHSKDLDDRILSTAFVLVGALWLILFSLFAGEPLTFSADLRLLVALLSGGLLVAVISWLQSHVFKNVSGSLSGSILTTEAFFATLIAWLMYGELPSSQQTLGGLIIVIGAIVAVLGQRSKAQGRLSLSLESECV